MTDAARAWVWRSSTAPTGRPWRAMLVNQPDRPRSFATHREAMEHALWIVVGRRAEEVSTVEY